MKQYKNNVLDSTPEWSVFENIFGNRLVPTYEDCEKKHDAIIQALRYWSSEYNMRLLADVINDNEKNVVQPFQSEFTRRTECGISRGKRRKNAVVASALILMGDVVNCRSMLLPFFESVCKHLTDGAYWELLRTVWIACGSVENSSRFISLMSAKRSNRYYFMTKEDDEYLRRLFANSSSGFVTVYRAYNEPDTGISWTLSKDYAEYYKKRYCKDSIRYVRVTKNDVFAYMSRGREDEVILLDKKYFRYGMIVDSLPTIGRTELYTMTRSL